MKLVIRDMTPADRSVYLTLAEEFVHSPAVLHAVPLSLLEQNFNHLLRESVFCRGLLLESDSVPCGYALLSFSYSTEVAGKVVWIEELYLSPEYRGQGIGRAFFRWLFSEYENVVKRFRLETTLQNCRARKLYRQFGFEDLEYRQMCLDLPKEKGDEQ